MRMRATLLLASLAIGLVLSEAPGTRAQEYPTRPVVMSVGYAAGGSVDIVARIVAEELGNRLSQRVVVDNRPGASGMISADYVGRARPDGYVIGMVTTSQFGTNPHLYSKITYKLGDFSPIAMVVKAPIGVAVANTVPVGSIKEFQAYARENGPKMTYGSFGLGTNAQLVNEVMNTSLGFTMEHTPYSQGSMARTDLMSGQIQVLVDALATLAPLHNERKIRLIGNFNDVRSPLVPDVPTFLESGFPDLVAYTWFGLVAPAGTPSAVVEKLEMAARDVVESNEVRSRLDKAGFVAQYMTGTELVVQINEDYQRWGPVITRLGIKLD